MLAGRESRADELNDGLPPAISSVGDVDGDGLADLAVASRGDRDERLWVVSGANGSLLLEVRPSYGGDRLGRAATPVGDLDGDGRGEFAVACHLGTRRLVSGRVSYAMIGPDGENREQASAAVYVFSGRDGSVVDRLSSNETGDGFGFSIAGGGDADGDGRHDLLVGAPTAAGGAGCVHVYSVAAGASLGRISANRAHLRVVGPGMDAGPVLATEERGFSELGRAVAFVPDADGDGLDEIAVGSRGRWFDVAPSTCGWFVPPPACSAGYRTRAPRVDVMSGLGGSRVAAFQYPRWDRAEGDAPWAVHPVAGPDGERSLLVTSVNDWWRVESLCRPDGRLEHFSWTGYMESAFSSAAVLDDLDGDGVAELAFGANEAAKPSWFHAGWLRVHSGATGEELYRFEDRVNGIDVCALDDVDGDGTRDMAVYLSTSRVVWILSVARMQVIREIAVSSLE